MLTGDGAPEQQRHAAVVLGLSLAEAEIWF